MYQVGGPSCSAFVRGIFYYNCYLYLSAANCLLRAGKLTHTFEYEYIIVMYFLCKLSVGEGT